MKSGFTLIEISIVLVIVGLLIGGVLVGQSLIEAVRVNAQVKQFQQVEVAINLYKNKFRFLPGDDPLGGKFGVTTCGFTGGGATACNGNGNGVIGLYGGNVGGGNPAESSLFWQHLKHSQILPQYGQFGKFPNWNTQATQYYLENGFLPESTYKKKYALLPEIDANGTPLFLYSQYPQCKNAFRISQLVNTNDWSDAIRSGSVEESFAAALDAKLDDGIRYTGNFLALRAFGGATGCGGAYPWQAQTTVNYKVNNQGESCNVYMCFQ